jgi:hypothetical protein
LQQLPDSRFQPFVEYTAPFMVWWGLLLFLTKLGRLRQLDYELRDSETCVLDNVNALAGTQQETLPVCGTLTHYLSHLGPEALAGLRVKMMRALFRGKVLDGYRLLGRFRVVGVDGTGHVSFRRRHCEHCLTQTHGNRTYYFHNVLEAKLLTASGLALSMGNQFIDNRHLDGRTGAQAEAVKQDCELKAFARLAAQLKHDYPQTPLCIAGDNLLACGSTFQTCQFNGWKYVLTFKPGRMPDLWAEFQALLAASDQRPEVRYLPDGTRQTYRWVNEMVHVDAQDRPHQLNAIQCLETRDGKTTTFAWLTNFAVTAETVVAIGQHGGRDRWKIENGGFNAQKNGGYELEHVYGAREDLLACFYILLQIAHLILQLVEKGSLLRQVARQYGQTVVGLYGSLRNIARRLLECLRYVRLPPEAIEPSHRFQIRLDSS